MGPNNAGGPVLSASIYCLSWTATGSTDKNFFVVISKVSPIPSGVNMPGHYWRIYFSSIY